VRRWGWTRPRTPTTRAVELLRNFHLRVRIERIGPHGRGRIDTGRWRASAACGAATPGPAIHRRVLCRSPGACDPRRASWPRSADGPARSARWNTDHSISVRVFVFEQVGVLQQAQKEIALLFKRELQQRQIAPARVDRWLVAAQHRLHFREVRFGPSPVDPQVFAHFFRHGRRKQRAGAAAGCRPD